MSWALVSDEHSDARARALERLAVALRARGLRVGGFVQRAERDAAGREGYTVVDVRTGQRARLGHEATRTSSEGELIVCDYAFSLGAFATARRWIDAACGEVDVWIVDGIGKMEKSGKGHAAALAAAIATGRPVVVGARSSQLFEIMTRLGLDDAPIAAIEDVREERAWLGFVATLERALL